MPLVGSSSGSGHHRARDSGQPPASSGSANLSAAAAVIGVRRAITLLFFSDACGRLLRQTWQGPCPRTAGASARLTTSSPASISEVVLREGGGAKADK